MNCIIGGQGVGKSAIIEFIRFALENVPENEASKKDHDEKLQSLLHIGGVVTVEFRKTNGARYRITRTYDNQQNPRLIEQINDDGSLTEYALPELQRYFPIIAYSQNEAVHVARSTMRQLDLIDNHLDLSGERRTIRDLMMQLRTNTEELLQLDTKKDDLDEKLKQKSDLEKEIPHDEAKLKEFEEAQKVDAIRERQAWLAENEFFDQLKIARNQIKEQLLEKIDEIDVASLQIDLPVSQLGHEAELSNVLLVSSSIATYLETLKRIFQRNLSRFGLWRLMLHKLG